ncbi:helix-turn-helix domain-containing protein [Novosphingobium fuchskuhlense]|jgi:excisionase family DNA binding protein|uniref:helix-turn-helix domain-containing protein n=1 Tax=Novosphingobium fuchskuhlense TaxID=1117702 RepID=UPI0009EA9AA7
MIRRTTNISTPYGEQLALPFGRQKRSEAAPLEPFTVRISEAMRLTGLRRSKVYELIASGDIEVVKVGRCSLVVVASLRALIERGRQAPS